MTHSMNLHSAPFAMIQNGQKTIELRLYDEKRRTIQPGDTIVFTNTENGSVLEAMVERLHLFDSFEALYRQLPLLQCGYTKDDVANASPADMDQYYSADRLQRYGVVGIEVSLINKTNEV